MNNTIDILLSENRHMRKIIEKRKQEIKELEFSIKHNLRVINYIGMVLTVDQYWSEG